MRKVKNYNLEFKQSSAKLAASAEQPIAQTARELGVNINTLHGWLIKYHRGCGKPLDQQAKPSPAEENKRLRKENHRLRQERDILKKAAAYFASEAL